MYIKTMNGEKYARVKNLPYVTVPYKNSPGGLFDPEIFGVTDDEKMMNEAMFDLGKPYVKGMFMRAAKSIWRDMYLLCCTSQGYKIVGGDLVKCDEDDPEVGHGVDFLYNNFDKIDFSRLKVDLAGPGLLANKLAKNRLSKVTKEEMFTRSVYIMPLAYRDEGGNEERVIITNETNQLIESLMTAVNIRRSPSGEILSKDNLDAMIQVKILDIYNFVVDKFGGSHGDAKKAVMSRVVDNSGRLVLVPNEYRSKKIGGEKISLNRAGIPIKEVLKFYIDFVIRGTRMFIENLFTLGAFKELDKVYLDTFGYEFINERIEMFDKSPRSRLDHVMIPYQDREPEPIMLDFELEDGTLINKPLTWLELFYIVCIDYARTEEKWMFMTRYPTLTEKNSKASQVHTLTLLQYDLTRTVTVLGRTYEDFFPFVTDEIVAKGVDRIFENGLRLDVPVTKRFDGDHDKFVHFI